MAAKSTLASSATQKLLQGLVAVACLTKVSADNAQMKVASIQELCFKYYHGQKGDGDEVIHESILDQFLIGQGPFDICWQSSQTTNEKILNPVMARGDLVINGVSVTRLSLSRAKQTGPACISGKAILNAANKHIKEAKKMLACEQSFLKNGQPPSGLNEDDLKRSTFDAYVQKHLTSKRTHVVDSDDDDDEDGGEEGDASGGGGGGGGEAAGSSASKLTGWMVYVLFGPRAKRANGTSNTSVLLLLSAAADKIPPGSGRSSVRNGEAEAESGKRKAGDTGGQSGERGISVGGTKKDAALVAQGDEAARQRNRETCVLITTQALESKQKRLQLLYTKIALPAFASRASAIALEIDELEEEIKKDEASLVRMGQEAQQQQQPAEVADFLGAFSAKVKRLELSGYQSPTGSSSKSSPSSGATGD